MWDNKLKVKEFQKKFKHYCKSLTINELFSMPL